MSEDERVRITAQDEEQDEVEAHRKHMQANDEGTDTEGDDDFEAHRTSARKPAAMD